MPDTTNTTAKPRTRGRKPLIVEVPDNATQSPSTATLEAQVLSLTDQLTKSRDAEGVLTNTLTESRKINQEREKQLGSVQTALRTIEDKWSISQMQLTHAQGEAKDLKQEVKRLTDLQSLTADELGAAMAEADAAKDNLAAFTKAHHDVAQQLATSRRNELHFAATAEQLRGALKSSAESLAQEKRAGWVETWAAAIVSATVAGLAFYLIGRFGR